MGLSQFKPAAGFYRFYGLVLQKAWLRMLGVVALIEAAIGLLYFIMSFISPPAANDMWKYIVNHPLVVITPALFAIGWLFLLAAYRQHTNEVGKEYQSAREAQALAEKAVADRDQIQASVSDIGKWEEADTILKRSIERGNQIKEKCLRLQEVRNPMEEMGNTVKVWVFKTREALERINAKWAEQFVPMVASI